MRTSSMFRTVIMAVLVAAPIAACTGSSTSEKESLSIVNGGGQCTFTQGFWKNHEEVWPVSSLTLGNVSYTKAELLRILRTPVRGNGLISLSHQLIAAKLNVAFGAPYSNIGDEIEEADDLIGNLVVPPIGSGHLDTSVTSYLNDELDEFNNSQLSGYECKPEPECGDGYVDYGEECDDGNTYSGDGCSATCEIEKKAPCCGDGYLDYGEECDDGNTYSGDGCSATCEIEKVPCCGDGYLDYGEECDDGNTTSYDGCSSTCTNEHVYD